MVNSLLDFSRSEAGRIEAVFEPVDLSALTADLASVFRSAVERAGMKLIVDCTTLPQAAYVDREMWKKVVFNLLSNAFKFTFEGAITVSLQAVGGNVELAVSDTGTGIPAGELPHLFERFHRVMGAHGRSYEGSGIGLALVAELAKLHGGQVAVQSEPGRGSTFRVSLPLGKTHLPADRIGAERALVSTELRGEAYVEEALRWLHEPDTDDFAFVSDPAIERVGEKRDVKRSITSARVLMVDDNTDIREYVRQLLSGRYAVVTAPDGEAALKIVGEQAFDLVLTDVMMPKLDGFGLLKALRVDERTRAMPVILLSARAGEESRVEGLQAGADDYLIKPFSARELLARVEAHLNLQRLRREAERAVRERTAQFETLLNQAPLGVYLVDADGCIGQANPMARLVLGAGHDLIGSQMEDMMHRLWPRQPAHELLHRLQHTLQTGESAVLAEPLDVRARRGQSEYYQWQLNRIPLPDNRPGIVCYIVDITAQVLARQAVAELEENFRLLVTASSDSLYRMSADWSQMHTLRGEGFLADTDGPSRNWLQSYIPADDQPLVQLIIDEAIRTKTPFELEHRVMGVDGSVGWTFSRAIPLLDTGRNILEWFGAASDITPRKQAEQSLIDSEARYRQLSAELEQQVQQRTQQLQVSIGNLQRSNENLAQFAYVASHDLQEPLRKIRQFGDLLQTQYPPALGDGRLYLDRMQLSASRMSVLIKDRLSYSRIVTGQEATDPVPLNGVLDTVLTDLDLVISETGAQVTVESLPTIRGDASQLSQLFGNLLSNALKFRQPGRVPAVRVSAGCVAAIDLPAAVQPSRLAATYHRIEVADNGIGFDDRYADRIFQVFQRLHGKSQYTGTGIGLAICEKVAVNHGGAIKTSSQPGQGATFSVYLPV